MSFLISFTTSLETALKQRAYFGLATPERLIQNSIQMTAPPHNARWNEIKIAGTAKGSAPETERKVVVSGIINFKSKKDEVMAPDQKESFLRSVSNSLNIPLIDVP